MASEGADDTAGVAATMPEQKNEDPGHIATAERVPLFSWGSQSAPSLPSIDDQQSVYSEPDSAVQSIRSSTVSVNSSIYDFVEEDGRTYHRYKEGKYHLPNDQEEQDRLDLQHALFLMTTKGRLYLAPIPDDVQSCLDVGTGTGIWAIEFAQQHPSASVLGTDLSPIQPAYVPVNCEFEIDDAEDDWTFGRRFDFVHARTLVSCFQDHKAVIKSCYDSIQPGGWCEWQDFLLPFSSVGSVPDDCTTIKWSNLIIESAAKIGRHWDNVGKYKKYFEEVGFTNVVEKRFYWPLGLWAKGDYYKSLAVYWREDMMRGIEPLSMKLLPLLGWTKDEIQILLAKVRKDWDRTDVHVYHTIVFVYGQKPYDVTSKTHA